VKRSIGIFVTLLGAITILLIASAPANACHSHYQCMKQFFAMKELRAVHKAEQKACRIALHECIKACNQEFKGKGNKDARWDCKCNCREQEFPECEPGGGSGGGGGGPECPVIEENCDIASSLIGPAGTIKFCSGLNEGFQFYSKINGEYSGIPSPEMECQIRPFAERIDVQYIMIQSDPLGCPNIQSGVYFLDTNKEQIQDINFFVVMQQAVADLHSCLTTITGTTVNQQALEECAFSMLGQGLEGCPIGQVFGVFSDPGSELKFDKLEWIGTLSTQLISQMPSLMRLYAEQLIDENQNPYTYDKLSECFMQKLGFSQ